MEVRYSPYNSPFVPHDAKPGVYYIGREYRDMPHSAHVYQYIKEQGRLHVERMHLEYTSAVAELPQLDELASDGIKAAARRADSIRKFLSPNSKKQSFKHFPAKRTPASVLRGVR